MFSIKIPRNMLCIGQVVDLPVYYILSTIELPVYPLR